MEARYARGQVAPEFGVDPNLGGRLLEMPTRDDSLSTLSQKMTALEAVVKRHRSLAVATGLMGTAKQTTDPVEAAKGVMSVVELEMYEDWQAGTRLEGWSKSKCVKDKSKFGGNEKSMAKWLVGLQAMYKDPSLTAEHVSWIATERAFLAPCLLAHATVEGMKKGMLVMGKDLTAEELAEYQTCKRIIATAAFRVAEIKKIINEHTGLIDKAVKYVQGVEEIYARRMRTTTVHEAPINRERTQLGKRKLAGPGNLEDLKRRQGGSVRRVAEEGDRAARRRLGRLAISREASPEYAPQSPRLGETNPVTTALGDVMDI
ncbi:hypothetical protein [Lichen RNA virus 1]|nr:hypothetical protein [Lichen RNA virus 1]